MTGVSERGRRKLYFDPTFVTVSQQLAELYSLTSLFSGFFCRSNPSQPHINNACVHNAFVLYLLSVTALQKDEGYFLRRPFCSLNIRPKFKMTGVSERGRRKLYFDPTVVTVSQKLADLYSLTSLFSGFFCHSNPSQPHIYNACVHNAFVLYLLSVTALQTDEGYFPSAAV